MGRSFQPRATIRGRLRPSIHRGLIVAVLLALCLSLLPGFATAAPPSAGMMNGWSHAETTHFRIYVQAGDPAAAANFTVVNGGAMETAYSELTLLFPIQPPTEKPALYVYTDGAAFSAAQNAIGRSEIPGISVFADQTTSDITLLLSSFNKMSEIEATNQLRHAISHLVTGIASGGNMPWGFDEGIAQYIERPVNEKLARTASLVQSSNQRGALPSWFDMNRPNAFVDPPVAAAQSYAVISFLIDGFGIVPLRQFLTELRTASVWTDAMRTAYGRDPNDMEKQWAQNLSTWTAGKWRENLVAAFDLEPAKTLLAQANYAAAKAALDPSQALFEQLDAPDQLALVKGMIAQCDIGIQAESLMVQTQQALESNAYDRAANLLSQAKLQFAQLPPEQQPTDMIASYETLSNNGLTAASRLDEATRMSHSWRDYPEARRAAREAGTTYSALGDEAGKNRAQAVLDDLDRRQRRIVLLLGALAVLTIVWLGLWLWARGPSELRWG
jgi:hypothetical protein